jgi:hypothetical protein
MAALGAAGLQHVHEQRLMVGFSERLSSADDAGASLREVEVITPPAEEDVPAMREHLRHVFTHFILRNVPLLLKGGVSHWPCTTRWTDEYLDANVGHCELRVSRSPAREPLAAAPTPSTSVSRRVPGGSSAVVC